MVRDPNGSENQSLFFSIFLKRILIELILLPLGKNSLFEIANIGKLKSNFRYYENKGDIIFASENIFEISNKKEFSRKFQLNSKKINDINKIYFDLEKNIDSKEFFISNIHLNKIDEKKFTEDFYKIKNIHIFRALIRNILS